MLLLPVHYAVTPQGNYSDGIHMQVCYVSVAMYLTLCTGILLRNCGNYAGLDDTWYRIAVRTRTDNQRLIEAREDVLR